MRPKQIQLHDTWTSISRLDYIQPSDFLEFAGGKVTCQMFRRNLTGKKFVTYSTLTANSHYFAPSLESTQQAGY